MILQDDSKLLDMDINTMVVTALVCHQESLASEADSSVIVTCSASSAAASPTSSSSAPVSCHKRRRTTSLPDILEEDSIT